MTQEPLLSAHPGEAEAPPVLLTMAAYHGTLAAARCLGSNGIPVTVADPGLFAPARWSRFATRRLFCPPVQEADRFVRWLLEFGRRSPGHVLYPTSDDVAWLCALHREQLASFFHLYQPTVEVIYALLNKRQLFHLCADVGIDTPRTWFPEDAKAVRQLAPDLEYPVLIKPQTQILFWPHSKGVVATSPASLRTAYDHFIRNTSHSSTLLAFDPRVGRPMIQAYLPEAVESIYNLSGFVDDTGELFVTRASRKVLQRPRQLGVGLCFEDAGLNPALATKLLALCRKVRYHGVFEAEFIEHGGRSLLIDFNPRFYGQMAFDVARELPLPVLVYESALGRRDRLRAAVQKARTSPLADPQGRAYCNRLEFEMLLGLQRLVGAMRSGDLARWKAWVAQKREVLTDAILDGKDRGPAFAKVAVELFGLVRHPRSTVRQLASGK